MNRRLGLILLLFWISNVLPAQVNINWEATYGGTLNDFPYGGTIQLSDGGYLISGFSNSPLSGNKSEGTSGSFDGWIVKLGPDGSFDWQKTYGGINDDRIYDAVALAEGGAVLFGYTLSPNPDGNEGLYDYWLIKIDNNGQIIWEKTYGGSRSDYGWSIDQCQDGGFILAGFTSSPQSGDKSADSKGGQDYWIVKVNAEGEKDWDCTLGGGGDDFAQRIIQTSDGGYLVSGRSLSQAGGDKSENNYSSAQNAWVVKINAQGQLLWDNTLVSVDNYHVGVAEQQGAYYILSRAHPNAVGDQSAPTEGTVNHDFWLVRLDAHTGAQVWDKTYGGLGYEEGSQIQASPDGNLVLLGRSFSNISGDKSEEAIGKDDNWLVKVDPEGNVIWDQTIGTPDNDGSYYASMQLEADGRITLATLTKTPSAGGYKSQPGFGAYDYWIYQFQEPVAAFRPFVTTWETASAGESITIPTHPDFSYNYSVDWGDGSVSTGQTGDASHAYANPGTYTVSIRGDFPALYFTKSPHENKLRIRSIQQWGDIQWKSMHKAFQNCRNLRTSQGSPDLSQVKDMSHMFNGAIHFNGDIGSWDVSGVTNMNSMFANAYDFNQSLNDWNVARVKDMQYMFYHGNSFNGDIGAWDVSGVTLMRDMFKSAKNFNQDISAWDVSGVTRMDGMFAGAHAFNQNLAAWDISGVSTMSTMFNVSGMSVANYDASLIGWSQLSNLKSGVVLGAKGLKYCDSESARLMLSSTYGWVFWKDAKDPNCGASARPAPEAASVHEIYPNPTSDRLEIQGEKQTGIMIISPLGQVMYRSREHKSHHEIDIAAYPEGMYLLLIRSDGQSVKKEIIIKQ